MIKGWKVYEEVATALLDQFASHFGLARVEGKQKLAGLGSGTTWEIDAKGVRDPGGAIIVVECRRYPGRKVTQELTAALAYRIQDIGAEGGILVSPLGLQTGARSIAEAEEIVEVQLDPNSTPKDFAMRFFGKLMAGASLKFEVTAGMMLDAEVLRQCKICGQCFSVVDNEHRCPNCDESTDS